MNPLETIMASEYSVGKWEREKNRMAHSLGGEADLRGEGGKEQADISGLLATPSPSLGLNFCQGPRFGLRA